MARTRQTNRNPRLRARVAAAAVLAAAALAGCANGTGHRSGTANAPATGLGTGATVDGARVFRNSCSACHTLAGVGAPHPSGGSLDAFHLTAEQAASFTRVMPTAGSLSEREIQAVAGYVAATERRRQPVR